MKEIGERKGETEIWGERKKTERESKEMGGKEKGEERGRRRRGTHPSFTGTLGLHF